MAREEQKPGRDEAAVLAVFDPGAGQSIASLLAAAERATPASDPPAARATFADVLAIATAYSKNLQPWTKPPAHADGVLVLHVRRVRAGSACPEIRRRAVAVGLAVLDLRTHRVFAPPALQSQFEGDGWPVRPTAATTTTDGTPEWLCPGRFVVHGTLGRCRVLDVGSYGKRSVFVVELGDGSVRALDIEHGLPHVRPVPAE